MKDKNTERIRRSRRTRHQIKKVEAVRLTVHRSNTHIYAQVIDDTQGRTLAAASTLDKALRDTSKMENIYTFLITDFFFKPKP